MRYNHRLLERKWLKVWQGNPRQFGDLSQSHVQLICKDDLRFDLENARLFVLADFFSFIWTGKRTQISSAHSPENWSILAAQLGLEFAQCRGEKEVYDLQVVPRDYAGLNFVEARKTLQVGRFLNTPVIDNYLGDFGGDALRLTFLFLGPPQRDYIFDWSRFVNSHRFVQRLWQLCQQPHVQVESGTSEQLNQLESLVHGRLRQQKPHTALAAVMEFLRKKTRLSELEVTVVARLLEPYIPFLANELLSLVPSV